MFWAAIDEGAAQSCGRKVASSDANPRTCWWTPEMKGWLVGLPVGPHSYCQAKRSAAQQVTETKPWLWQEFGDAMEQYFQSALKKFWRTARWLRRGKWNPVYSVFIVGGELLI